MKIKTKWTYEDEKECSQWYTWFMFYVMPEKEKAGHDLLQYEKYRVVTNLKNVRDLAKMLAKKLNKTPMSVYIKLRRVKQLSNDFNKQDDYVRIRPLKHHSKRLDKAFISSANCVHNEINHLPPPETFEESVARRKIEIEEEIKKYGTIIISQDPDLDWT